MAVRCKFVCDGVETNDDGTFGVNLSAVTNQTDDPEAENSRFWRYTPIGRLTFSTINETAAGQFEPGKEYYLDITPAE